MFGHFEKNYEKKFCEEGWLLASTEGAVRNLFHPHQIFLKYLGNIWNDFEEKLCGDCWFVAEKKVQFGTGFF